MPGSGNALLVGPVMNAAEVQVGRDLLECVPKMGQNGVATTGLAVRHGGDAGGHFV
jgi:hypothetical protein